MYLPHELWMQRKRSLRAQEARLNLRLWLWQLKEMLLLSAHLSIMAKALAGAYGNNPRILSFSFKNLGFSWNHKALLALTYFQVLLEVVTEHCTTSDSPPGNKIGPFKFFFSLISFCFNSHLSQQMLNASSWRVRKMITKPARLSLESLYPSPYDGEQMPQRNNFFSSLCFWLPFISISWGKYLRTF